MFAIFQLNLIELAVLGGLALLVVLIVLAVIFLASRGGQQNRRGDED